MHFKREIRHVRTAEQNFEIAAKVCMNLVDLFVLEIRIWLDYKTKGTGM